MFYRRSVAQRPRTAEGRTGGGCGRGSPPPTRGSGGVTPGKFFGFYIAVDDFWYIFKKARNHFECVKK